MRQFRDLDSAYTDEDAERGLGRPETFMLLLLGAGISLATLCCVVELMLRSW